MKSEVAYMEKVAVRGVAVDKDQAKVIVSGIVDRPGTAALVFRALADANIIVDMIVQNVGRQGVANLTFTVPLTDAAESPPRPRAAPGLARWRSGGGSRRASPKLSVVGVGMKTHCGVAATLFQALADAGVNIELISTSEIKISVIIAKAKADDAARIAHAAFGLG